MIFATAIELYNWEGYCSRFFVIIVCDLTEDVK